MPKGAIVNTDARKFRSYWKQQRRLEQQKGIRELLGKALDVARIFVANPVGGLVVAIVLVIVLNRNLHIITQRDEDHINGILLSAELIQGILGGLGGASGIGGLIAALK